MTLQLKVVSALRDPQVYPLGGLVPLRPLDHGVLHRSPNGGRLVLAMQAHYEDKEGKRSQPPPGYAVYEDTQEGLALFAVQLLDSLAANPQGETQRQIERANGPLRDLRVYLEETLQAGR